MPRQNNREKPSTPSSPNSEASTASILSDGQVVPARKRLHRPSSISTASTVSLDMDWISTWEPDLNMNQSNIPDDGIDEDPVPTPQKRFSSPHGRHNEYQLDEDPEQFLQRLPPSTTGLDQVGDWIWMHNPYFDRSSLGYPNLEAFVLRGDALLRSFDTYKEEVMMSNAKSQDKQTMIKKQRDDLPFALKNVAKEYNVTHGKWMLFVSEKDVDMVWLEVVRGTYEGVLGTGAKVAPAGSNSGRDRLICVYTKDFSDLVDVKRVVQEMKNRNLTQDGKRPIYYKADAWTYLGIDSKNNYGLRASLYSSKDILQDSNIAEPERAGK